MTANRLQAARRVLTFAALAGATSPAQAQHYSVVDLGTLGHTISEAYDINDSGVIVGYSTTFADGYWYAHAFQWRDGVMIDLGLLPGGKKSSATGINATGVVCGIAESREGFGTDDHPFRWGGNGPIIDIGTLGGSFGAAKGINDLGHIVGQSKTGNGEYYGFRWFNGQMTILQPFPNGVESGAEAINDLGQAVGLAWPQGENARAALWEADGSVVDLGNLFPGRASWAFSINNHTEVTGWGGNDRNQRRAFLWRQGQMESLGTLPYDTNSEGRGINDAGVVVGVSWYGGHDPGQGYQRGFVWDRGVMYDLNELLPTGSTWWIRSASAINSSGQIVGTGQINGQTHAFLMTPIDNSIGVTAPRPGIAGQPNTIMARGAAPGARVDFVYGFQTGSTSVPGCPGLTLEIGAAVHIGGEIADADGVARITRDVPPRAAGQAVYVQSVERASCRTSNRVRYTFR